MQKRMKSLLLLGALVPGIAVSEPIVINPGISPDLKRVEVDLSWTADSPEQRAQSFNSPNWQDRLEPTKAAFAPAWAKKGDAYAFLLCKVNPDTEYWLFTRKETDLLGEEEDGESGPNWGELYKVVGGKRELLDRGFIRSSGSQLTDTVATSWSESPVPIYVGFRTMGSSNGRPEIVPVTLSAGVLKGSLISGNFRIDVTVRPDARDSRLADSKLHFLMSPVDREGDSITTMGTLAKSASVGGATVLVESFDPIDRKIVLAVVSGDVEKLSTSPLENGWELPGFSQPDLLRRESVKSSELLEAAKESGWLVMVFGNFEINFASPFMSGVAGNNIPRPDTLVETLGRGLKAPPTLAVVSNRVGMGLLYRDYLDQTPSWYLLADNLNPVETQLIAETSQSHFEGQPDARKLRSLFGLPLHRPVVLVFDSNGVLKFSRASNSKSIVSDLQAANAFMRNPSDAAK